ncbi:hypothetical protein HYH02_002488 [Chlamydomonas schloesseri]|uniref:Uncharacterized protein n=1 Tax=Chlamydomonas schloesseri TaxID=2026947 RepID=A0A835WS52_9CHLO|nr:hypothetical protein HYH02_002488 [Chlamydomonas schloesseri]|eukprot:KAG2453163.1 hypothetical protein HYH02_002488 [Chlamydomonas schloesseri]
MADLLRGWPGASGAPNTAPVSVASSRLPVHVNPIPASKASRRAKYGGVGAAELEEQKRRRQPAARVDRPKPLRGSQLFLHIIRGAESQQSSPVPAAEADRQDSPPPPGPGPLSGPSEVEEAAGGGFRRRAKLFADSRDAPHPRTTARIVARLAACRNWRHPLSSRLLPKYLPLFDEHAAAYFFRHVPMLQPLGPSSLQPHHEGTEMHSGLLLRRRQQHLEQQLQPGTSGVVQGTLVPASEERGFRLMVEAVCCSLLPKIPHFGPRAMSYMASGLGRMGIWCGPAMCAWDAASVGVLGLMRPDQLVSTLEGRAQLVATAAAAPRALAEVPAAATAGGFEARSAEADGRGRPPPAWRDAAVVAVEAALDRMSVSELARVLEALRGLGVKPTPALVEAACRRVVAALAEAAAAIANATQPATAPAAASISGASAQPLPHKIASSAAASTPVAATGTLPLLAGLVGTAAASAPPATPAPALAPRSMPFSPAAASAQTSISSVGPPPGFPAQQLGHAGSHLQPPGANLGEGLAAFVCALGRTDMGQGQHMRSWWLDWLMAETGAVLRAQVGAVERQRLAEQEAERVAQTARGRRAMRRALAAAAEQQQVFGAEAQPVIAATGAAAAAAASGPLGLQGKPLSSSPTTRTGTAGAPPTAGPFFSLQALAALAQGVVRLWQSHKDQQHPASVTRAPPGSVPGGDCGDERAPMLHEWLDQLLAAAVHDLQGRLSPAAAAAAMDSAAAAAPTAVITAGDVSLAEAAAAAATAGAAAAMSRAAAAAAQPASVLLAAVLQLSLGESSSASTLQQQTVSGEEPAQQRFAPKSTVWRALAGPELGLRLLPYMSPAAMLVWVRALATWGDPDSAGDGGRAAARRAQRQAQPHAAPPTSLDRWSAAVHAASRTRFDQFTGSELCQLPLAVAAAGLRLPPGWAAAYVHSLSKRLAARAPSPGVEAQSDQAGAVGLGEAAEALAALRSAAPGAWPFVGVVAPDAVQVLAAIYGQAAATIGGAAGPEAGGRAAPGSMPQGDNRLQREKMSRANLTAGQLEAVVVALDEAVGGLTVG